VIPVAGSSGLPAAEEHGGREETSPEGGQPQAARLFRSTHHGVSL